MTLQNESTAPESEALQLLLQDLVEVSQALLHCHENDIEDLEALIAARETKIQALKPMVPTMMDPPQREVISPLWAKLQAIDQAVLTHLEAIHCNQAKQLQALHNSRLALSGYEFPRVSEESGYQDKA